MKEKILQVIKKWFQISMNNLAISHYPHSFDFDLVWNLPKAPGKVTVFGKTYDTPRYQQSYNRGYTFSGNSHPGLPIPPELQSVWDWGQTQGTYNQLFLNWYDDGKHYIGAHRDDESDLVSGSDILSVSFGATRTFRIRDYHTKQIVTDLDLTDGTVVKMNHPFNRDYTHEIVKTSKPVGRRINITFRRFK